MTTTQGIRVLLVDDQELVRKGFALLLDAAPNITVVGQAADGEAALRQLAATPADVVLMDIRMRGMGGIAATREILHRHPTGPKVLILTTFDDDAALYAALDVGASGFLLKGCRAEDLLAAITAVHNGDSVLAPEMTRRMIAHLVARPGGLTDLAHPASGSSAPQPSTADPRLSTLTPREREVLSAVGRGSNNAEIARDLFLAESTVKTHIARIMYKVAVRDRVHLALLAHATGLVDLHQKE